MRTRAQDADSTALDLPYLSSAYGVSEPELQTLLDAPTAELVRTFLTSLTAKGQDYDTLKGDKLKLEVELENTVRTSETKVKAQKSAVTRHVKDAEELRKKLSEVEGARDSLSSELEQLRSSASGSTAETQALRQRIETLEASNRDTLALVESKSTENDRVATELSEQHGKLLTFRREISQLEERNQALDNAASSQKFKEQSLSQEIDLLKRNNEWYQNELQTRNQEHAKFRKERNARIANLQRELEDANASVESLRRTETSLKKRLDEVQGKADDAFARIASLQEDAARRDQGWKAELDGSKRLAELQAQNAATHKARLHDIQGQLDATKEDAANEIGQLQADIETERSDKEQAEAKVAELELKVEQLEAQPRASRAGTPMGNGAFDPATPGRVGSPFAFPGSLRKSRAFTNTEYVAKINELQQDLEAERRRTQKLSNALDEMANEMENQAPQLAEMQSDHDRLEEEVLNFSRLLEEANGHRDNAVKNSEHWQGEAEARNREGELLRQQLRDLSAQIKILLVEIQIRDDGLESMSNEERLELERAARGELQGSTQDSTWTANHLVSQKLVIFRNVAGLQDKNEELLRVARTMAEKMEGEEAQRKAAESEANAQEVEHLRQQVDRYRDELQATATQIDSYVKERDMFRRMLQHRGQLHPDADLHSMFGQSVPPATPQRNGADPVAQTPRSKDVEDLNKLLREQQVFFDQYRNESAEDRKTLKDQVDSLGRQNGALQTEVARLKGKREFLESRLEMLQGNYASLQNENTEHQKRSQQLAENAARQDLQTQRVTEDLVEARSMAESLRNENANAKAEKDLWKRIEARYMEDNKALTDERSRLNKHVADLQNLQNERELSDSETRRRLQSRVEGLESELIETKKKLDEEVDGSRKAVLRREYEEGQSRTRIDDLVKSLGNIREELVAAKTTRDQLQSRVDEMKIELRSAEEKVAALQPRPTPRSEPQQNGERQTNEDEELPAEQRLALEVSELRRDVELTKNELDSARQQVEQYKQISQSTEEELASFNETSDQYKEETDRQIAEKDAKARELQQRVDDLLAELTTTNNELSEIRSKHEDSSRVLNEQKSNFETEVARLNDDAERHAEEKKLYQEDIKAQAQIAQQAQQSYEDELLKHAEAAKSLQSVRKEYNALRTEVAGIRAEAEAARGGLERGEESWTEQRETFERELDEMKRRRQDVDEQNRLLHRQMESFSSELAALRSGRSMPTGEGDERTSTPSAGENNMQEVVKYLRREKEIVDVQYELSMQEAKRLQQQLDYANSQLEETRQKLSEERRQSAEKMASEGSTTKLMQTINELNLFRESSTTLRSEARQAREKLEEKSKEVERLLSEIDPLKVRVGELEGDVEGKEGEIKLLQDDRDHWRERTQNIISKYDRVDPAELEDLKKQLEELKAEKERLEGVQAPLKQQVEDAEKKVEQAVEDASKPLRDKLENFRNQAKEQNRKQVAKIKEGEAAVETASAEKAKVDEELQAARQELEETKTALEEAQNKAAAAHKEGNEEGEVDESDEGEEHAALHARIAEAEKSSSEHVSRAEALATEVQTLQARVQELEGQISTLQQQLDNALQGEEGELQQVGAVDSETLEKLRQELSNAQQEVETLRANANSAATEEQHVPNAEPAASEQTVADQVAEEVAKLRTELEHQHNLAIKQVEEDRDNRLQSMKTKLNQRLREEKEKLRDAARQELIQEHTAEVEKLKSEHEAAVTNSRDDHKAELERLSKEGSTAVEKAEAESVKAESTSATTQEWPTEEQVVELMKNNARIKSIFNNNVTKRVASSTEKLHKTVAEKDEEIAKLKDAQTTAASSEEVAELKKKVAAAEAEKNAALTAQKKMNVQVNMLGMVNAKIAVVRTAAKETPEKPVKEVWDVADKTKPTPKLPAAAAASSASPATTAPKSALPSSPAQALPSPVATTPQSLSEEDRVKQRQQRFGTGAAASQPTPVATGTFGQPSAPTSATQPQSQSVPATGGTFGQPSQLPNTGALSQPARRASMVVGPNPHAATFTPQQNATRGALGGNRGTGLQQPRAGGAVGRGGGIQIQGAASAPQNPQANAAPRGGAQSAIPRGAGNASRAGRGGGIPRGAANAGQKRQHEGGPSGDEKRVRGGTPGSS